MTPTLPKAALTKIYADVFVCQLRIFRAEYRQGSSQLESSDVQSSALSPEQAMARARMASSNDSRVLVAASRPVETSGKCTRKDLSSSVFIENSLQSFSARIMAKNCSKKNRCS